MKKNIIKNMNFKIIIFYNFIVHALLEEYCNNFLKTNKCFSNICNTYPNTKCIIDNMVIIENTNGDIYMDQNTDYKAIIFGTTLSNNDERVFHGMAYGDILEYFFEINEGGLPFLKKYIKTSERKEIKNSEIILWDRSYILLFGNNISYLETFNIEGESKFILIEPTNFLSGNKIIKGNLSLLKLIDKSFYFIGITSTEENSMNYYISFYEYTFTKPIINSNSINYKNNTNFESDIKNEYMSCDLINGNSLLISCFYLTKDNNYSIILFKKENGGFVMKNRTTINQKEDITFEKPYFMKVALYNLDFCVYAYYSGDLNDIPTFLIKTIDETDYLIKDKFLDFPVVHLYDDYKFNNEIKYNDLVIIRDNEFFFISTEIDKENIIISYIKFYLKDDKEQLLIRYYTISLKQNYNMKILNQLKAIYFKIKLNFPSFLTLGIDFCFNEDCENSNNTINNAGLIMLSFPNVITNNKLDFIEYAFKNNINYIILNLTEIFILQNNIFGYYIPYFFLMSEQVKMNGELEFVQIYPDNPLVKIDLIDDSESIMLEANIFMSLPKTVGKFNEYCNKINDTFGDKNDESSYTLNKKDYYSQMLYYYIYITDKLSNECNIENCDLCLETDPNYCIVCKDDKYYIIEDQKYFHGKLKICSEKKSDEITNEVIDKKTNEITDEITNEKTDKITNEITNEITDKKTNLITNQITNEKADKITNDITNQMTNEKTDKITNEITNEITEITDKITNEIAKEITNEIIDSKTNKITNEIINEITDKITNKVTDKITNEILTNFITENIIHKDTEEIINIMTNKLAIEKTERISNEEIKETISDLIEKFTNGITEKIKEEKAEIITDEYTKEITYKILDKLTNKDNTNYIINNIDTEKLINDLSNIIKTNGISNNTIISFEELMNDKYKNVTLSNEEIEEIYKHFKDYIKEKYDGNNTIINTSNVKIQISKIDDQKGSELSNIDLGKCEEILKNKYCKTKNDSLIMLKFDIKPQNETSTFVHYEVYSTKDKLYLELKECSGNKVIINVPIELSSEMEEIYEFLSQSGYNIFDSNDSFYNDICSSFTTQNGTDILLYDRRMDIYKTTLNISLCQEGCDFESYNIETKKAKCDCYSQKNDLSIEDLSDIKFDKNQMIDDFYQTIQNSNFRVLRCYKLVFNIKIFIKNIGSIGMSVLLALFNILIIIHLTLGSKKINSFIQMIIKHKYLENANNNSNNYDKQMKSKENDKKKANNKKKRKKRNSVIYNKNLSLGKIRDMKRKKTSINIDNKSIPPKRKNSKYKRIKDEGSKIDEKFLSNKNKRNYNLISSKMVTLNSNEKNANDSENTSKVRRKSKSKKNSKKLENDITVYHKHKDSKDKKPLLNHKRSTAIGIAKRRKSKKLTKKMKNLLNFSQNEETSTRLRNKTLDKNDSNNIEKTINLNTQELNSLKYEEALELDKRTYFQYYFSLLKKKHLILFTFLPTNDYNLMSLKIALFIVSFSMYFTIDTFFFNDETMHKIYQESGAYNIITQIPQILYSSIVSSIINMILKSLSLSEKDILKIKKEKDMHSTVKKSKSIEKCIKIKSFLFFTLSLLLMIFFWYFISCFCAVYYNTQIILIKNTLISFGLSMLYPIGINLIPGMFRIPALRAKKKNKKCLYSFSQFVALI